MLIPPILEIFVVWHPGDSLGRVCAEGLLDHYHGSAFSGLIGGAIEVYPRSAPWDESGAPRPIAVMEALPNGLPEPVVAVVVPVVGVNLARAVQEDEQGGWGTYLTSIARAATDRQNVAVFPIVLSATAYAPTTAVNRILGSLQSLKADGSDIPALARDLGHSISSFVDECPGERLKVFISHTKHPGPFESKADVRALIQQVRDIVCSTHMREFFDEADLQPGRDWSADLIENAESSALLIIRTDEFAGRDWCQREVLSAKRADMPVVTISALAGGENRGSFLMDHVPTVALRQTDDEVDRRRGVESALNKLVDEALKRSLWRRQRSRLHSYGFDWLPANAPEPLTLAHWLRKTSLAMTEGNRAFILHPDPPLGTAEANVLEDILSTSGREGLVEILTPRRFASRGGQVNL